jgi:hypothetical protein
MTKGLYHKTFYGGNKFRRLERQFTSQSIAFALTNAQAFYITELIKAVNCFMMQAPVKFNKEIRLRPELNT